MSIDRWEPSFYRHEFREELDALKRGRFPLVDLGSVIERIRYGTSSPPKYADAGIPFIRATNIKDGHMIQDEMKFMTPEETKNFEKCRLKEDDIIIVRSGVNTGDCARITKEFNNAFAAYDLILDLKSSVNSEYINVFLNLDFGKLQIQRVKARSAQPHLNANEVKSLKFPFPPREIQDKITSMMNGAYKTKGKKESEAENLLNSIETYVVGELGIDILGIEGK